MKKLIHLTLILALFAFARGAVAQLQIEIIDGNPSALPIAVVPFQWMEAGPPPADAVDAIVAGDLYRSGLFDPMAVEDMPEKPSEPEGIRFGTWRLLKVDYIVVGKVRTAADGMGHEIIYQLFDVHKTVIWVLLGRFSSNTATTAFSLPQSNISGCGSLNR